MSGHRRDGFSPIRPHQSFPVEENSQNTWSGLSLSFPSWLFVPHQRKKAHRASFLHNVRLSTGRAWAAISLWVKRRGGVGHNPHSSRAAPPGTSEISQKVIQASRTIANSHRFKQMTTEYIFFPLALNHCKTLLHVWSRVVKYFLGLTAQDGSSFGPIV